MSCPNNQRLGACERYTFFLQSKYGFLIEHLVHMDLALEKIIIPNAEVQQGYSFMTPIKYFPKGI